MAYGKFFSSFGIMVSMKSTKRLGTQSFAKLRLLMLDVAGYSVQLNDELRIWPHISFAAAITTRRLSSSMSFCRSLYHLSVKLLMHC